MASNYEIKVEKLLREANIKYKKEVSVQGLCGWREHHLRFDFMVFYHGQKMFIEVDGEYHFKPIRGKLALQRQREYDERKNKWCLINQIPLIRIPYWRIKDLTLSDIFNTPEFLVKNKLHNYMLCPP